MILAQVREIGFERRERYDRRLVANYRASTGAERHHGNPE